MYIVPLTGIETLTSIQDQTPIKPIQPGAGDIVPFADLLKEASQNLAQTQSRVETDVYELLTGQSSDLHQLTIDAALQQSAVEMTVQLTSRAVSAYKEILQMQI